MSQPALGLSDLAKKFASAGQGRWRLAAGREACEKRGPPFYAKRIAIDMMAPMARNQGITE